MERLQILWVTKTYAQPQAGVKVHQHPYYHMFHIRSGKARFFVAGKEFYVQAGQTLLVSYGVDHGYSNDETVKMEDYEIKFKLPPNALDASLQESGVVVTDNALAGQLVEQILQEYSDLGSRADDAAAAYLLTILNILTQQQRYQKQQKFRFIDASSYSELSQQIIRYLETNYAKDITLDSLSEALDYNKSYLCVAFKKDTQSTILDCLNMIRIRRAAELIVYSDHSLPQVAAMCGFASDSHFTRVFTRYVGITPGQCRRAHPANVLFGPHNSGQPEDRSGRFIYSVLAQKQITPEMIRQLDEQEKGQAEA